MAGVRFLAGAGDFTILHSVQAGSEVHQASDPLSIKVLSPGIKRPGLEAGGHSPPSSAEVNNEGVRPPLSHRSLWRGA